MGMFVYMYFFLLCRPLISIYECAGPKHGLPKHAAHMNMLTNRQSVFEPGKLHVAILLACVAQNVFCGPSMKHSTK